MAGNALSLSLLLLTAFSLRCGRLLGHIAYRFSVLPPVQQGLLPGLMQQFVFQSGELETGKEKFPILQLVIRNDADIVTSVTTDIADKAIEDYMFRLSFGFRPNFTPRAFARTRPSLVRLRMRSPVIFRPEPRCAASAAEPDSV